MMQLSPEKIEAYLKNLGEQERDIRKVLTTPTSTQQQRANALSVLNSIVAYIRGFVSCVNLADPTAAKHYKEFYEQARSKRGFRKE